MSLLRKEVLACICWSCGCAAWEGSIARLMAESAEFPLLSRAGSPSRRAMLSSGYPKVNV
jgi:hypothetical protein